MSKVMYPILARLISGSFGYTWTVHTSAVSADKDVVVIVTEQIKDVKKDLNDRITRAEKRIIEALQKLEQSLPRR